MSKQRADVELVMNYFTGEPELKIIPMDQPVRSQDGKNYYWFSNASNDGSKGAKIVAKNGIVQLFLSVAPDDTEQTVVTYTYATLGEVANTDSPDVSVGIYRRPETKRIETTVPALKPSDYSIF
ncbi:MAG: hypothetical protein AAF549_05600 [Pseudomonadota bacterium]